jgi:hypothetical protein
MKRTCLLLIAVFAPAAGAAYKCVDEKGVTRIGDTPPPECANVIMYETSRTGTVLKKIDPTPTAEQVKQRREEAERKSAEQKRKDMALLNTFSAEKEFDVTRDRQIEPIQGRMRQAQERIAGIEKRQKAIDEEMEFYKAGKKKAAGAKALEPPHMLVSENERLMNEKKQLQASIANGEKEIEQLKVRYDVDKKRWATLKAAEGKLPAGGSAPTTAPATPGAPVRK